MDSRVFRPRSKLKVSLAWVARESSEFTSHAYQLSIRSYSTTLMFSNSLANTTDSFEMTFKKDSESEQLHD